MVRLNVDIIVVVTTPAALAVMNATKTIPIMHPNAIDPLMDVTQPSNFEIIAPILDIASNFSAVSFAVQKSSINSKAGDLRLCGLYPHRFDLRREKACSLSWRLAAPGRRAEIVGTRFAGSTP